VRHTRLDARESQPKQLVLSGLMAPETCLSEASLRVRQMPNSTVWMNRKGGRSNLWLTSYNPVKIALNKTSKWDLQIASYDILVFHISQLCGCHHRNDAVLYKVTLNCATHETWCPGKSAHAACSIGFNGSRNLLIWSVIASPTNAKLNSLNESQWRTKQSLTRIL